MTGYFILAGFVVMVISHFTLFMVGMNKGRKGAEADYAEERAIREKDARLYEQTEREIKQEALHGAAEKKANLSGHGNNRDRFNAINDSLSNKPKS